jgi:hypothetical protein
VSTTDRTQAQRERATYGWSLLLDEGDLVLDGGRLQEISGRANLEQALLCRILTPWSSDRLTTTYGLDVSAAFTTGLTRDLAKQLLRLNLVRTLAADPRIAEVLHVHFDDDPEYLAANPGAAGRPSRRLALVEIAVRLVPATQPGGVLPTQTVGVADTVTFLTEVRW